MVAPTIIDREEMMRSMRAAVAALLSCCLFGGVALAQNNAVKIGVLDDMSGTFADQQGMGDVVSARMAIEDFGGRALGAPVDRTGRVLVEPDLSLPGYPEAFVVGDLSTFAHGLERPLPGTAAVAWQEGRWAAANIGRDLAGRPRQPFKYRHQGSLAIIGRGHGVADFGIFRLAGFSAWLAWLFVHIYLLIGFEHRLLVMLQWGWAYLSRGSRTARLITAGAAGAPSSRREPAATPGREVDAA
jgi:hypothetical protein